MNHSLKDVLTDHRADIDTVQHAVRYYLGERTDDLSPAEMRDRLVRAAGSPETVDSMVRTLTRNSELVESAGLVTLSCAWPEANQAERIQGAIADAKAKLPVVESAVLAIVALYGMYLVVTGGIKKAETVVQRNPDGSFQERRTVEYFGPSSPLASLVNLFKSGDAGA